MGMAQQTAADDDVSTELKAAVNSAKGTAVPYGSSAPSAKQAADGRWFVNFSTSHSYGRSNAVDAMQEIIPEMALNYSPHGSNQVAAKRVPEAERPTEDEAEDLVQEGLEYVNQRGYTARITEADYFVKAEYPDSQFGDSKTEPKADRLAEELVKGTVAVLSDPRENETEDEQHEIRTDGGQEETQTGHFGCPHCEQAGYHPLVGTPAAECDTANSLPDAVFECVHCGENFDKFDALDASEADSPTICTDGGQPMDSALAAEREMVAQNSEQANPHHHTSVWAAAENCETHEDGSSPRLGVEYRKKNGNGTARKAGTVAHIEVSQPEDHFGQGVGQPTPRIVFERDDGQQMYVEPDGLYTSGSHAPYVGSVVGLTTSTTSTVEAPEALGEAEQEASSAQESGPTAEAPSVNSMEDLADWIDRTSEAHAEVGSTHYSWDIPGFGRSNDPHGGRTAVRNGNECAYIEVRGPRSDGLEQALAKLAHQHDLCVSISSHRATLVPPQGGL